MAAQSRGNYANYTEEEMQLAITACTEGGQPAAAAARVHGVPLSSLRSRVKHIASFADAQQPQTLGLHAGVSVPATHMRSHKQKHLEDSDLQMLKDWIFLQDDCNVSVTKRSILWKVRDLMILRGREDKLGKRGLPGKCWWRSFRYTS